MIGGIFRSTWSRARNVVQRPFYSASRWQEASGHLRYRRTNPALRNLDASWEIIRDEVLGILPERNKIPGYHELDRG